VLFRSLIDDLAQDQLLPRGEHGCSLGALRVGLEARLELEQPARARADRSGRRARHERERLDRAAHEEVEVGVGEMGTWISAGIRPG